MKYQWKDEQEARQDILEAVSQYYHNYKENKKPFKPGDKISYAGRVFDDKEMKNLAEAMLDFWLTSGRFANEFEQEFSKYIGVKYASLVNSGSSANLIAVAALTSPELGERQIRPGDEVITVSAGFPTTINPIIQCGAIPVFIDVTIPQYNIDVSQLENALSDKTKAVILAHTMGNPFDLKAVKQFCDKNNLWLIEDNCDALGSVYNLDGKKYLTGSVGDIGTSSFYPPHHITLGEGGCVYTNNPLLHRLIRSFRDWGRDCMCASGQDNLCKHRFDGQYGELPHGYDHKFVYSHFGYNLKITDLQAAIGCEQLKKLPSFVEKRRHNWQRLHDILSESKAASKLILPVAEKNSEPSWFGFLMTLTDGINRENVVPVLENKGIQTRMLFSGNLLRHPCFNQMRQNNSGFRVVGSLNNADRIMKDTFWVGVYPGMSDDMVDYIAKSIIDILG